MADQIDPTRPAVGGLFTFGVPDDIQQKISQGLAALRGPAPAGGAAPSFADALNARFGGMFGGAPAMTPPLPAAAAPAVAPAANAPTAPLAATPRFNTGAGVFGAAPAASRPKRGAAMPAGPAAPLVPGETGYWVTANGASQLVPYANNNIVGSGGGIYDNLPGGGKMVNGQFADARDRLEVSTRLRQQAMSDFGQMLSDTQRSAFEYQTADRANQLRQFNSAVGSPGTPGYIATAQALAHLFNSGGFPAANATGLSSVNSALAHLQASALGAGASEFGAESALQGVFAHVGELGREFNQGIVPVGSEPVYGPGGFFMGSMPTYGMRGQNGAAPTPIDTARPKAAPKEGATGTYNGKTYVIKNGKPVLAE